jgi:hypothetical protein
MSRPIELVLLRGNNDMAFTGRITSLPLDEELIIKKSIEFYNDEFPCFIHRSAVMKRLYMELESFIEEGFRIGRNEWKLSEMPDGLKDIISKMAPIERIIAT